MGMLKELRRLSMWRKSGGKGTPEPTAQAPPQEFTGHSFEAILNVRTAQQNEGNEESGKALELDTQSLSFTPSAKGKDGAPCDASLSLPQDSPLSAAAAKKAAASPAARGRSASPSPAAGKAAAAAALASPAAGGKAAAAAATSAAAARGAAAVADTQRQQPGTDARGANPWGQSTDSTRCVSRASSDQDALVFDAPLDVVYNIVGEAFGQMIATSLRSTKWDKRVQAMKAIGSVVKGLECPKSEPGATGGAGALGKGLQTRDRVRCWRATCQLLNHVMGDKVMPVRIATHELFMDVFANIADIRREEVSYALGVLLQHVFDKLGDSNLRLHESARKCVLFCADRPELLGLNAVLSSMRDRLDIGAFSDVASPTSGGFQTTASGGFKTTLSGGFNKNGGSKAAQKAYFGILDTVNFLLKHFPGDRGGEAEEDDDDDDEIFGEREVGETPPRGSGSWTQHDVACFVIAGMDDSLGHRVRSSALQLAVTLYQTFGMEAMLPMLGCLRPAKQAVLRQKFRESEEEEEEPPKFEDEGSDDGEEVRTVGFEDLMVTGRAVKPPCGLQLPPLGSTAPLPKLLEGSVDEENLMDGILEEAGMVFNGAGITNGFGFETTASFDLHSHLLEQEHRLLEEELMNIGMGLDDLEEQQALLISLQEEGANRRVGISSVEVF